MTKKFVLAFIVYVSAMTVTAQNVKRPESYNYQRGVEALQEEKNEEALDYFNKDLKENPKNGYSYSWIAHLRLRMEDYGRALNAAEQAIKYLPKKDVEYVTFAYSTRALTYLGLEDTLKAVNDITTAIKITPNDERLYDRRAQIYFEQEKYDLADADYRKMIELKPGDVMGYMGIGRNAKELKHWDEAIEQFSYALKLADNYSSGYAFRAEAYIGKQEWAKATDDLISALRCQWDDKAVYLARNLEEPAFTMMVSKLKVQSIKSPNEITWPYVAGLMHEVKKKYTKAIEYYTESNKRSASPVTYKRISECYKRSGEYENALRSIEQALNMDSTDVSYSIDRADVLYELGRVDEAIAEYDNILLKEPEYAGGYYQRGWYKELARDFDGAIEDQSMAIVLEPDEPYYYVTRGSLYQMKGQNDLAKADYEKVIELENTPEKYSCIHYAYQGLGQNDKAIAAMDTIIARDEDRAGSYYDAACLYSRMENKEKALHYLEKAMEMGYRRFAHIERDHDMDFIRNSEEFKTVITKYKKREIADENSEGATLGTEVRPTTTEVPFTKENGVCKVKCQVNGLPLHFVFDTGASDVTLSMVEATFMMKNGYLSGKDVIGSQRYMDANGEVSVGTIINLKDVNFGGQSLTNVRASVVRNQKAPLLLGQSVLGRLGRIEIDNAKNVIKITRNSTF